MIQLPATFGPDRLDVLDRYLASLPGALCFAVELRHRGFYREPIRERVDQLLAERSCERIVIDTGGLRSGDQRHPDLLAARHRKPDLPISSTALGPYPLLRLICHPDQAVNLPWLERWSWHVARWVRQGKRPYAIVHCPNNLYSPPLTRRLHAFVSEHVEVGEIPPWPGEEDAGKGQLSLL